MVEHDLQETVERLRRFQEEHNFTLTALSKLSGVKPSTLSELVTGAYKGSGKFITVKLERFLNYRERLDAEPFGEEGPPETVETKAFTTVTTLCAYAQKHGVGAIVLGDAGVGKTTALRQYALANPNAYYVGCNETMWGRAQLIRAIGQAVGAAHLARSFWVRRDVIEILAGSRGILLLDDAHFLGVMSINTIQTIHDETRVGFVLAGKPLLHAQMSQSRDAEWFDQILSRCAAMRRIDSHAASRENVIAVAHAALPGREITPGAENILVEQSRVRGAMRRVAQIALVAADYAGKGQVGEQEVRKAVAWRGEA